MFCYGYLRATVLATSIVPLCLVKQVRSGDELVKFSVMLVKCYVIGYICLL